MADLAGASVRAPAPAVPAGVGWRGIAVLAAAVVTALAMYGAGVLLPYYVNDLHRLPLTEVSSGAHDPKDLWPQGPTGGLAQLAGFSSLVVLPFVAVTAVGVGGLSLVSLARRPQPQRVAKALALLVLVALVVAAASFMFSATGAALTLWRLD